MSLQGCLQGKRGRKAITINFMNFRNTFFSATLSDSFILALSPYRYRDNSLFAVGQELNTQGSWFHSSCCGYYTALEGRKSPCGVIMGVPLPPCATPTPQWLRQLTFELSFLHHRYLTGSKVLVLRTKEQHVSWMFLFV